MLAGKVFFSNYCSATNQPVKILDLGGMDVNGSLRQVAPAHCTYIGADMAQGKGVDVLVTDTTRLPFEDNAFDVIVSSSCLEHDDFFWLTFNEMLRVLKPNGFIYLNVPSNANYHRYPNDSWRFYPDSAKALVRWGKRSGYDVELVESFILNQMRDVWNDFVAVVQKTNAPEQPAKYMHQFFPEAHNIWTTHATKPINLRARTEDQLNRVAQ